MLESLITFRCRGLLLLGLFHSKDIGWFGWLICFSLDTTFFIYLSWHFKSVTFAPCKNRMGSIFQRVPGGKWGLSTNLSTQKTSLKMSSLAHVWLVAGHPRRSLSDIRMALGFSSRLCYSIWNFWWLSSLVWCVMCCLVGLLEAPMISWDIVVYQEKSLMTVKGVAATVAK